MYFVVRFPKQKILGIAKISEHVQNILLSKCETAKCKNNYSECRNRFPTNSKNQIQKPISIFFSLNRPITARLGWPIPVNLDQPNHPSPLFKNKLMKLTYAESRIFLSFFFLRNEGVLMPFFFFLSFFGDPSDTERSLENEPCKQNAIL